MSARRSAGVTPWTRIGPVLTRASHIPPGPSLRRLHGGSEEIPVLTGPPPLVAALRQDERALPHRMPMWKGASRVHGTVSLRRPTWHGTCAKGGHIAALRPQSGRPAATSRRSPVRIHCLEKPFPRLPEPTVPRSLALRLSPPAFLPPQWRTDGRRAVLRSSWSITRLVGCTGSDFP